MTIHSLEGRQVLSRHREEADKKHRILRRWRTGKKKMNKTKVPKRCSLYF